jgi:SAM-dependent methyltransferase
MAYVFDFHDAANDAKRFEAVRKKKEPDIRNQVMLEMLTPLRGDSVLDIGCGIGASLLCLIDKGLKATGIDPSPYMLDFAMKNVGSRVDLHRGFAEDLPFDDNSFNHVCLNHTLEFVDDPHKAIEEASRVAKNSIYIGAFNKFAVSCIWIRTSGMFKKSIYNRARFFSVWELKFFVSSILGDVPVNWKTVGTFPLTSYRSAAGAKQSIIIEKFPFNAFVSMVVVPVPRFKTNPLPITYRAKQPTETAVS